MRPAHEVFPEETVSKTVHADTVDFLIAYAKENYPTRDYWSSPGKTSIYILPDVKDTSRVIKVSVTDLTDGQTNPFNFFHQKRLHADVVKRYHDATLNKDQLQFEFDEPELNESSSKPSTGKK